MEAYPLHWPIGYKRATTRISSRFEQTMDKAQRSLQKEVERLGGTRLIVSSNLRVRTDGMLYAADLNKKIPDPGVAIYFHYQGKDISMCCDQYERVWENIYALAKGIEALRSLERWGVSDFINRVFTGFVAIPERIETPWHEVLNVFPGASEKEIKDAYRKLAKLHHSDYGGDREIFEKINQAYKAALNE